LHAVSDQPGTVQWIFDQNDNNVLHPNVLVFDRGNIGIGTASTAPNAKLDVVGWIRSNGVSTGRLVLPNNTCRQVTISMRGAYGMPDVVLCDSEEVLTGGGGKLLFS